jgi:prevent-host-death family protein
VAQLSIRDLNANISKVIDRVEAGEVIDISRNGKVVAELRPKRPVRDAAWWKARREMEESLKSAFLSGIGKISEEDRYGDADL